ncbi:FAD-binding oxidoreductase [Insolitispirillum peregrinum]|uniref:D-lactate dehydrogenase (cytochrome) n=1 Tax=Insolitispirillum peregrinum TaxID=80876 RepID=A0A1N7PMY6_9PROT|nr:FAD-linked oxidase C-terminal domain-containing protein [Insolitispirillum peregrinum]SIT11962.1 D-lactate dehydrogenase (cytochrome) [Insolitispirillum peregrinum]
MTAPLFASVAPAPSPSADALAACLDDLRSLLGDRLSTAQVIRDQHGRDESYHTPAAPDAVAFALTTDEVVAIVNTCSRHGVPIIPFGTGTSLEGHIAALHGGVCVDVSGMNAILSVRPADMDVTVQAGVTRKQLNEYLRDTGLFFPIDPGADASLGGMASTRASGTNAVRYGTMRENVLSLTVVLADGRVIRTARRARKSAAGYDLTRLFVGSEGTLGIITEVTVRLYGIPEAVVAAVCPFPDVGAAVNTVIDTIQLGIPVARVEFLDENQMDAVNRFSKLSYAVTPTLFFEFHGSDEAIAAQAETVKELAAAHGGVDFQWTANADERDKLWHARHNAFYAALALKPGSKGISSDTCVPISRLADCVIETKHDLQQSFLKSTMVGHVGDGNFHVLFLVDPDSPQDIAEAKRLNSRLVMRAIEMDGTCTGEHGIGHGKRDYLTHELGDAMDVMRAVKAALDPQNLFNPGKII